MDYCPNCGAKVQPKQNFCTKCGYKLTVSPKTRVKPSLSSYTNVSYQNFDYSRPTAYEIDRQRHRKILRIVIIVTIVVIIGIVMVLSLIK